MKLESWKPKPPLVQCLKCGWVGRNIKDPRNKYAVPCPKCDYIYCEIYRGGVKDADED